MSAQTQADILRSRQLNPCDHYYWKCRGYSERPHNWREILDSGCLDDGADENSRQTESETSENQWESDSDESYEDDASGSDYEENRLRSLQQNPNNDEYWRARGFPNRPDDWQARINGTVPKKASKNEWWKYGKNCI